MKSIEEQAIDAIKEYELAKLTDSERHLLFRNKEWVKVVLELWSEERNGISSELTEYGYYYDLMDKNIITHEEFNKLVQNIKQ